MTSTYLYDLQSILQVMHSTYNVYFPSLIYQTQKMMLLTYATSTVSVQSSVGGTETMKTAISVNTDVSTGTACTLINI